MPSDRVSEDEFEDDRPASGSGFHVDLDGFEGPIDLLLSLARDHKVDLTHISILGLADQYLEFIARLKRESIEIAADYLVMAAWLAYLKSRLLLPAREDVVDEPSAEEMAEALAFQLRRLEAMQDAAAQLMALPQAGEDFFYGRGQVEVSVVTSVVYDASLYDLLSAYAGIEKQRSDSQELHIRASRLYSVESAMTRLKRVLGVATDWQSLLAFLPDGLADDLQWRSATAATFAASLELAKGGGLELRQAEAFGPIMVRNNRSENDVERS